MIFSSPANEETIDQGDIIDGCPILSIVRFDEKLKSIETAHSFCRVLFMTHTCDFANKKVSAVSVAIVREAQTLIDESLLKAVDIRGPIRSGRIYGWYFLPSYAPGGLRESIVDLRQIHTVRMDLLAALCLRGLRCARIAPLYREHLAKHFADGYSRIGLPEPYPTE